jgi:hypothetical protein
MEHGASNLGVSSMKLDDASIKRPVLSSLDADELVCNTDIPIVILDKRRQMDKILLNVVRD